MFASPRVNLNLMSSVISRTLELPRTDDPVPAHTWARINKRIRAQTLANISRFVGAPSSEIDERLRDLKREWDIERTLEANVARVALLGLGLSIFDRRFLALPVAVVATCLLQHALQAWCSQLPVFRRLGVRTSAKIHADIIALRTLRGDFRDLRDEDPDEALARADT